MHQGSPQRQVQHFTHKNNWNAHDAQTGGKFPVVCPPCPLFNVQYFKRGKLYCIKTSVVHSLAHSTRRQDAAEAGERNSCKGDDRFLPNVQDTCGISTGNNSKDDDEEEREKHMFYWYVGTFTAYWHVVRQICIKCSKFKSGNSFAIQFSQAKYSTYWTSQS